MFRQHTSSSELRRPCITGHSDAATVTAASRSGPAADKKTPLLKTLRNVSPFPVGHLLKRPGRGLDGSNALVWLDSHRRSIYYTARISVCPAGDSSPPAKRRSPRAEYSQLGQMHGFSGVPPAPDGDSGRAANYAIFGVRLSRFPMGRHHRVVSSSESSRCLDT